MGHIDPGRIPYRQLMRDHELRQQENEARALRRAQQDPDGDLRVGPLRRLGRALARRLRHEDETAGA